MKKNSTFFFLFIFFSVWNMEKFLVGLFFYKGGVYRGRTFSRYIYI